jgi:hypothetical protein
MPEIDRMELAATIRNACVRAALEGYEQAQIVGLCQEGAWEAAIDAIRMLDLKAILDGTADSLGIPPPRP